jgi:hypothetical protein
MNQSFSLSRFWLLLKLDFAANGKTYLGTAGLIVGLMVLLMSGVLFSGVYRNLLELLHTLALFMCVLLGGGLFTSTVFAQYGFPDRGIHALMVPASRLEKFLVALLVNMAFMVPFITVFWQLHHLFFGIANAKLPTPGPQYRVIPPDPRIFLTYSFFLIQGAVFLGSIYFSKMAFVKTAGTFLGVSLVVFFFNLWMSNQVIAPTTMFAFPFDGWRFFRDRPYEVNFPETVQYMKWSFLLLMVVALWAVAFVRLREKQI